MAVPPAFGDLGKAARDLFDKEFGKTLHWFIELEIVLMGLVDTELCVVFVRLSKGQTYFEDKDRIRSGK